MTTLQTDFQRKVTAYLERTGVNGRQLGISALQSFGFVSRLNRGRYPNLTNADRVLRFIGEPPIRPSFQREVEAFLRVTGMSVTKFGDAAAGSQEFVKKLRNGASLHLATVDRVRQWMRDNTCASQRATIARMVEDPEEDLTAPAPDPEPQRAPLGASTPSTPDTTNPPPEDETVFLSSSQSAAFLALSSRALDRFRWDGTGPAYYLMGRRCVYALPDLLQWASERRQGKPRASHDYDWDEAADNRDAYGTGRSSPDPSALAPNPRARSSPDRTTRASKLDDSFRLAVFAYIRRSQLSGQQFGQLALGDPGFVPGLDAGGPVSLDTADRVLRFIGETPIGPMFRREVEAFLSVTGGGGVTLGFKAVGDPSFVARLRKGSSPRLATIQKVRAWMRETATGPQRTAVARLIADSGEAAPVLSSNPAALSALVQASPSPSYSPAVPRRFQKIFFTSREAAEFLMLSPRTVDRYRSTGKGPVFHKFGGRAVYFLGDLKDWAMTRRQGGSD